MAFFTTIACRVLRVIADVAAELHCWADDLRRDMEDEDEDEDEDTTALPSLGDWVAWAEAHPLLFDEFTPRPMTNPLHALLDAHRYPIIATFEDEED